MAVYPEYQSEEQRDREQVEVVFGLGGGELETENWAGYAYWYQDPPEYAARDFPDYVEEDLDIALEYRTVIVTGGGFLPHPSETLTDAEGSVWQLVGTFTSSGESDCWVCGAGTGDAFAEGFFDTYNREPQAGDECGLCEYKFEDQPGSVYVGDGYEAVYRHAYDSDENDVQLIEQDGEWVELD